MNTLTTVYPESMFQRSARLWAWACERANVLSPLGDLALRLWVANEFFKSGLTKIQSWETTLQLFQYEVPSSPPPSGAGGCHGRRDGAWHTGDLVSGVGSAWARDALRLGRGVVRTFRARPRPTLD